MAKSKLIKTFYSDSNTLCAVSVKISEEDYDFVMKLRKMNKSKLKKILQYVGAKQVLKLSAISLALSVDGFKTEWGNFKVIV